MTTEERERCVLVLAPFGRDAALTCEILKRANFPCLMCPDFDAFLEELGKGPGAVVVAEEAFSSERIRIACAVLARQGRWSDLPFVILTGGGRTTEQGQARTGALETLGHVTFLERPVRTGTLLSAVRAAWRSRQRQYELRDYLTARENTEQALFEHAQKLARANADLEQFAYVTSHDLKEPLRTIAGFAQLLARAYRGRLDPNADEYIEYITNGVQRMQAVIEDLLAYSKLVHQPASAFRPVKLNQVVEWARENLKKQIEDSSALIHVQELPTVRGDQVELVTLFQNLLSNALKYRRTGVPVRIDVEASREPTEWHISIRDNGIGFKPEYAERIFELFKRLHGRDVPGTGLGLTIARKVMDRHKGRIWAESAGDDQGASLHLTFPTL